MRDYNAMMVQLRDSFPSLRYDFGPRSEHGYDCPEGNPSEWDPVVLDNWVTGGAGTSGSRAAAAFVLNVWNSTYEWKVGPFNLRYALGVWDSEHQAAFRAWVMEPFFP